MVYFFVECLYTEQQLKQIQLIRVPNTMAWTLDRFTIRF